ncbi:MAG: TRAP transporter small permease [Desulfobacterales bacterium]|nr:TRAP transporter small permease [Desulfobacterales bacterium]
MVKLNNSNSKISFINILLKAEELLLAFFLIIMILLVVSQVFLRYLFNTGIPGSDTIVRPLVLWIGFLGAGIATREDGHIKIEAISRNLPSTIKNIVEIIVNIFSIIICFFLIYASISFVTIEYEGGNNLPFLEVPVWIIQIILPIGFFIICLRFIIKTFTSFTKIIKRRNS